MRVPALTMPMTHIQAICLDLDDTLWNLGPVLEQAERQVQLWFARHWPRMSHRYSIAAIRSLRMELAAGIPDVIHDFRQLRRDVYAEMARHCDYPESVADAAVDLFQEARNQVEPYADVGPALQRLARRFPLIALTNGTADLDTIGLRHHFSAVFSAWEMGVAKPDQRAFQAVCDSLSLEASAIAHAGDHPRQDVEGARAAGLEAIWVDRGHHDWPGGLRTASHVVEDLNELAALVGA